MPKKNATNQDANEQPVNVRRRRRAAPRPQMAVLEGLNAAPQPQMAVLGGRQARVVEDLSIIVPVEFEQDSPQRAEWIDDDDYCLRNQDCIESFTPEVDLTLPRKRCALAPAALGARKTMPQTQDLFSKLPDELLLHVFHYMPSARDRSACAAVSMRWLKLQSHMQRKDFFIRQSQSKLLICAGDKKDDESHNQEAAPGSVVDVFDDDRRVQRQAQWAMGDLSRCLEGKKTTDVRLAAIAVGTGGLGGLVHLCIEGGGLVGVSDWGLSAIGFCCAALQNLVLWDCPNITDEGITVIGKGCRLLHTVGLMKCPLIGDSGVSSIAKNAFLLSVLTIDECPLIGDTALCAVSACCSDLMYLNLRSCPRVSVDGLKAVVQNCTKLHRLKLHKLRVGDKVLLSIGVHCTALQTLSLSSLDLVTEDGFLSLCNSRVMALKHVTIENCNSFSDTTLVVLGNRFVDLQHISLTDCEGISDQGVMEFLRIALSLKILHVEGCDHITGISLMSALSSTTGSLKEIHFNHCHSIKDTGNMGLPSPMFVRDNSAITSLCLTYSGGVGDKCLSQAGLLCNNQLTDLNIMGLTDVTDEGLLALLKGTGCNLTSINFSGCIKLTDHAVVAIAKQCGESLTSIVLDWCKMVTDVGFQAIGKNCVCLEHLSVFHCKITDVGVKAVVSTSGATLSSLNLSGCGRITNQVLGFIEKSCGSLQDLNLHQCKLLTQRRINEFSARLGTCNVSD